MESAIEWIESLYRAIMAYMQTERQDNEMPQDQSKEPAAPIVAPISTSSDPDNPVQQVSRIDLWLKAAIRMEGANPANHNPINIRFVPGTWEARLAVGQHNGFCVFKDDAAGHEIARNFFVYACTGKSSRYPVWLTVYEFYAGIKGDGVRGIKGQDYGGFAPASDSNDPRHYAEDMAAAMAVPPTIQIGKIV